MNTERQRYRVFLSVGRQKDPRHLKFVAKLKDMLDVAGLEVTQLPNTFENPLDRVLQELRQSHGALIICFERLFAKSAIEFRNSDQPGPQLKPLQAPTIWNHVEAAMAKAAGVPVLILAENGCRADGMLDPVVQFKIHWMDFDADLLSQKYFRQLFDGWIGAVATHSSNRKASLVDVSALRFGDILRSLKVSDVAAILGALATVFGAGFYLGGYLPKLLSQ